MQGHEGVRVGDYIEKELLKQDEVRVSNQQLAKDIRKFDKGHERILENIRDRGKRDRPSTGKLYSNKSSTPNMFIHDENFDNADLRNNYILADNQYDAHKNIFSSSNSRSRSKSKGSAKIRLQSGKHRSNLSQDAFVSQSMRPSKSRPRSAYPNKDGTQRFQTDRELIRVLSEKGRSMQVGPYLQDGPRRRVRPDNNKMRQSNNNRIQELVEEGADQEDPSVRDDETQILYKQSQQHLDTHEQFQI
jgi:hypothetical protein